MSGLKVLSVASEVFPLVKTGGLADVAGALPGALAREDVEMRTLVPGYPAVKDKLGEAKVAREYADLFGGPARLLAGRAAGLDLFALDAPHLFDRPGNPYLGPDGRTGRTTRAASPRSPGSGPTSGSAPLRPSSRTSCTPTTGRRASPPPISGIPGDPAPARSSRSTTWPSRAISRCRCSGSSACRTRR